jgi:hypothetical protein
MKILFGYLRSEGYNKLTNLTSSVLAYMERLNRSGFDIKPFCMNYSDLYPLVYFKDLDKLWKFRDSRLLSLYERFLKDSEDCDVFYNSVGVNFHPSFIESVPIFTVYCCNDDPENSDNLSKPVASSYDMCAIGNIAEIETYRSWGCKNVEWNPLGIVGRLYDPQLTYEKILANERDIDVFMMIDRLYPRSDRKYRCDLVEKAFPEGHFYGRGWKRGYLPQGQEVAIMQRVKIGINMHNSTGPINTRLFYLPANGILQICDNKSHLGKIFELDKEVIGFETIEECIDKCHYYLTHKDEARQIAANGWLRVHKDYNEIAVFERLQSNIKKYYFKKEFMEGNKGDILPKRSISIQSNLHYIYMVTRSKIGKLLKG